MHLVVLAGGSGTRLWPVSRSLRPKQFLKFCQEGSLLQKAFQRNQPLTDQKNYFIANFNHISLIEEQLREVGTEDYTLIIEPESKNTAPAIIAAALEIYKHDPEGLMLVTPSDNEIGNVAEYQSKVTLARNLAKQGYYVALGVAPNRPEVAYGYLKKGKEIKQGVHTVGRFIEKPSIDKANEYLITGEYYWNSGIFIFPVKHLLEEMALLEAEMLSQVQTSLELATICGRNIFLAGNPFSLISANSIDYALMEKTDKLVFINCDFSWSDMGTWYNIWETQQKDSNGNVLGHGAVAYNTRNSFVVPQGGRLIATVDVENISIIETPDVLLVANTNSSQNVKDIVTELGFNKRPEVLHHILKDVAMPRYAGAAGLPRRRKTDIEQCYGEAGNNEDWGTCKDLVEGDGFLIRQITVRPGHAFLLRYHNYQSKHWMITKGVAEVKVDNKVRVVKGSGQVFIPRHAKHGLVNLGRENVELIELYSKQFKNLVGSKGRARGAL